MTVFFRCNSGHYFSRAVCPWDGWSLTAFEDVLKLVEQFRSVGKPISVATPRDAGVPDDVLKRIMIVEFGSSETAVEAIYPKQLIVRGRVTDLIQLPF